LTKNAIMLVDFAIEEMGRGVWRLEAIVDAGRKRARPIVMTTIAMIGGMLPSAFGLGSGGEFRAPMAIAVIGGLLSSTLLSILFVPAVFSVMDDIAGMIWGYFRRCVGEADEPAEPARPTPTRTGAPRHMVCRLRPSGSPGAGEGNLPSRPPAFPALQGHTVRPRLCPWGDACGRARRIPCSMFEACSISSCAATRDRKIGAHRPAPKIWAICWPNSPLAVGKARHLRLAAGPLAGIFGAPMRSPGRRAAATGRGTSI